MDAHIRVWLARVRSLFTRRRDDDTLREEIETHLALESDRLRRSGMSPATARLAARRSFGGVEAVKERYRDQRTLRWVEDAGRDLRMALRSLRRAPGFTLVAVVTLALGIGANTAIFSVVEALMFRSLPVDRPEELVQLARVSSGAARPSYSFSYPLARGLAREGGIFAALSGFAMDTLAVGDPGSLESTEAALVDGDYFRTLGISATAGRLLDPSDDREGAQPVAVLSDGYWRRRYGRDSRIIGRTLRIDGVPVPIVGVTTRGFSGAVVGRVADLTLTVHGAAQLRPEARGLLDERAFQMNVLARLRSDVTGGQARARLKAVWPGVVESSIAAAGPMRDRQRALSIDVQPGGRGVSGLRQPLQSPLIVLMAIVGVLLAVACANVASLLVARTLGRRREITTRLSLGASPGRVARQLLTESLLLAVIGAVAGAILATFGTPALISLAAAIPRGPDGGTLILDVAPDAAVLLFTTALALVSGCLAGCLPALSVKTIAPRRSLPSLSAPAPGRAGRALVVAQVAVSAFLLVGAGLFVRSLSKLYERDPGFDYRNVALAPVDLENAGVEGARVASTILDLQRMAATVTGVESVSFSRVSPLEGREMSFGVQVNGRAPDSEEAVFNMIGPRYFATLLTPLIAGREFTDADTSGSSRVAIVNRAFARRYLDAGDPLVQRIAIAGLRDSSMQIVGVVEDAVYHTLRQEPPPTVYTPFLQAAETRATFEIRVREKSPSTASLLRQVFESRLAAATLVRPMSEQVGTSLAIERMLALLVGSFGGLALAMAAVGVYGLLAYNVARRIPEIGVRTALGATGAHIASIIVRDSTRLLGLGAALGIPAAWAGFRIVGSMLYGLSSTDVTATAGALLVIALAGFAATLAPARRAASTDPLIALRCE